MAAAVVVGNGALGAAYLSLAGSPVLLDFVTTPQGGGEVLTTWSTL